MPSYRRMPPISVIAQLKAQDVDASGHHASARLEARQLRDVRGFYSRERQPYIRRFSPIKARRQRQEALRASKTPLKPHSPR